MDKLLKGLPWWLKWVAVPIIALIVFGSLVSLLVGLLFKVIVFVILVGALVLVVKKVTGGGDGSSGSGRDW